MNLGAQTRRRFERHEVPHQREASAPSVEALGQRQRDRQVAIGRRDAELKIDLTVDAHD